MLGFFLFWLFNSTIVAVVAGFQSGSMGAGQWVIALAGGLVLNWVEVKTLGFVFGEIRPVLDPTTGALVGTSKAQPGLLNRSPVPQRHGADGTETGGFTYNRFGFRFVVTPTAIEMGSRVRGRTVIPLASLIGIQPHATGAFTLAWRDAERGLLSFKANLGERNSEAFRAIDGPAQRSRPCTRPTSS
jgi:hypothetical protein